VTFFATRPHFSPPRSKKVNQKGGGSLRAADFCHSGNSL
jgi:hypothetical protein